MGGPFFRFLDLLADRLRLALRELDLHQLARFIPAEIPAKRQLVHHPLHLFLFAGFGAPHLLFIGRRVRNVFIQGIARHTEPSGGNRVGPAITMRNIPSREYLDQISACDNPYHPQRTGIESEPPCHVLVLD